MNDIETTTNMQRLAEKLVNARQLTKKIEDSIRYANWCKVKKFQEEFEELCKKHEGVKVLIDKHGEHGYPAILALIESPEGLGCEKVRLV